MISPVEKRDANNHAESIEVAAAVSRKRAIYGKVQDGRNPGAAESRG